MEQNNQQANQVNPTPSQQPTVSANETVSQKNGNRKGITLLILVLLLVIGIALFILFTINQANNINMNSTSTNIPEPTLATFEGNLDIEDPEADLQDLEAGVNQL